LIFVWATVLYSTTYSTSKFPRHAIMLSDWLLRITRSQQGCCQVVAHFNNLRMAYYVTFLTCLSAFLYNASSHRLLKRLSISLNFLFAEVPGEHRRYSTFNSSLHPTAPKENSRSHLLDMAWTMGHLACHKACLRIAQESGYPVCSSQWF
jgi:hypothetical protein